MRFVDFTLGKIYPHTSVAKLETNKGIELTKRQLQKQPINQEFSKRAIDVA